MNFRYEVSLEMGMNCGLMLQWIGPTDVVWAPRIPHPASFHGYLLRRGGRAGADKLKYKLIPIELEVLSATDETRFK